MNKRKLQLEQLELKLRVVSPLVKLPIPPAGWVKLVRTSLGMSLQQVARRLGITRQSMLQLEKREAEGTVSLRTLREAAHAMDMELVYGFVPKDGSLDALIDRKAHELAEKIVSRTSQTMKLEDQEITYGRRKKAIEERTETLKREMPRILWD